MQITNSFSNQESLEQHIRDLLGAQNIPPGYIDDYIDCIFAYSSLEDYTGITDDIILNDFEEWIEGEWKGAK